MRNKLFPIIKFFGKIDSTNALARTWLSAKKRDRNAVFVAKQQTHGKGRGIREWFSPNGGLYFTMIFHDSILPPSVTLFSGVIIHKILTQRIPANEFLLKWPNDIMIGNKKVCGILTFTSQNATCIGVGINCNIRRFPDDLSEIATSVYIETGEKVTVKELLADVLKLFSDKIDEFTTFGFRPFKEYFKSYHMLTEKKVALRLANKIIIGKVKELSNNGTLILDTDDGVKEFFAADKIDILS